MKNFHTIQRTRPIAILLLGVFVTNIVLPLLLPAPVYAGGPTQPEVHGFTPIGMTEMVDPFSGDFTYNIPLMDIEGYPVNIAYHSGISTDQEASWVGLGWALNMGSVNRGMRGLPDDFDGDIVEKTQVTKPNMTVGIDFGVSAELFSFLGLSASAAVDWNNYNGFATTLSVSPSVKFGSSSGLSGTAGFSLSGSSENGASFSPSFSLGKKIDSDASQDTKLNLNIGSSFNSRAGLQGISYGATLSRQTYATKQVTKDNVTTTERDTDKPSTGGGSQSVNGSFDLGLHTYTPTAGQSMRGVSFAGNVNLGGSIFAIDPSFKIGLTFSSNWIPNDLKTVHSPGYGYFNLQHGQHKDNALLDFNRDNDGSFTKYSVNLPTAYLQPDVFSVAAQGTGGSFRGFRDDIGYVFDPAVTSVFDAGNLSLEFGMGNLTDFGGDVSYNNTSSRSGAWRSMNDAVDYLKFSDLPAAMGSYTIQEASESSADTDPVMPILLRGSNPVALKMGWPRGPAQVFLHLHSDFISPGGDGSLGQTKRSVKRKTNQAMYFLTVGDLQNGMGISPAPAICADAKPYHIGEITQLGMDGRRYVFGIPAYNHFQKDVTFAIGAGQTGTMGPTDDFGGLITYDPTSDATTGNEKGLDHYYQSTLTPAYAHSFMLTSVLSDDYTDADAVQGPSVGDMGSYVKFSYSEITDHRWRTPVEKNTAYYNEGLKVDATDDKASYVYGEKDLWYVKMVETKNYIAIFELENREDAYSVTDEDGGLDPSSAKAMQLLRKISLYSRADYEANPASATPLQEVHFEYTYDLCHGYPANIFGNGKLTLTKIWFSYQKSNKMARRSYEFQYNGLNPDYDLKACDRWGTYAPMNGTGAEDPSATAFTNSDYSYTTQNKAHADQYASAWCLTDILLPSGGKITVDYESDDYAYVQHKKASRMFNIVSMGEGGVPDLISTAPQLQDVSNSSVNNRQVFFQFDDVNDRIEDYFGHEPSYSAPVQIYFRVMMDFKPGLPTNQKGRFEFVSGYADVTHVDVVTIGGVKYGAFYMEPDKLKDSDPKTYSPMTKTGILMGRMHMSRFMTDVINNTLDGNSSSEIKDFASSVVNAVGSFGELITGPNKRIFDQGKCQKIMVNKSFIRLFEPDGVKLGGGARVKRIRMNDNWSAMDAGASAQSYEYGQEFSYTLEDGTSSGVASYEPQLGGDENPFHTAYTVTHELRFQPDNNLIIENPLMESQFPSPGIGYARVEIKDLPRPGVIRTATGKVVKEFYTARDFPTIVTTTAIIAPAVSTSRVKLGPSYNYMDASQGFSIELNDMHGKTKQESVYAEGGTSPISKVTYEYQCAPLNLDGVSNFRLTSEAKVLSSDGTQSSAELGVHYDMTADFRESETKSIGGSMNLNLNAMLFGYFPLALPIAFPKLNMSHDRFRSATLTKVVQRFGILKRTSADQDGSIVETSNLSYDSETGQVISTQTTTDFNDKIYSLTYPAHWKYTALGGAYKNIGYVTSVSLDGGGYASVSSSVPLTAGDELIVYLGSGPVKGWITERNGGGIKVVNQLGSPISGTGLIKVIRSGYRNKQQMSMANLTALVNPESGVMTGSYQQVLNAGAIELSDNWRTYCECFSTGQFNTNSYVNGTKGNFRPAKSFTHLSGRTQSNYDDNTNIRRDGVFTSYSPYYYLDGGTWKVNPSNWTFISEVTQFSPNGMTLETRDALGRYSTSSFGFNNTLTTAVAANTSMQELSIGHFEDAQLQSYTDPGLFHAGPSDVSTTYAHTGRYSIRIPSGSYKIFSSSGSPCDNDDCPFEELGITGRTGNLLLPTGEAFQIESYEILYGDVIPELVGNQIIISSTVDYSMYITLTRGGCRWKLKLTSSKGNDAQPSITLIN